jgi:hypothetical protein
MTHPRIPLPIPVGLTDARDAAIAFVPVRGTRHTGRPDLRRHACLQGVPLGGRDTRAASSRET